MHPHRLLSGCTCTALPAWAVHQQCASPTCTGSAACTWTTRTSTSRACGHGEKGSAVALHCGSVGAANPLEWRPRCPFLVSLRHARCVSALRSTPNARRAPVLPLSACSARHTASAATLSISSYSTSQCSPAVHLFPFAAGPNVTPSGVPRGTCSAAKAPSALRQRRRTRSPRWTTATGWRCSTRCTRAASAPPRRSRALAATTARPGVAAFGTALRAAN